MRLARNQRRRAFVLRLGVYSLNAVALWTRLNGRARRGEKRCLMVVEAKEASGAVGCINTRFLHWNLVYLDSDGLTRSLLLEEQVVDCRHAIVCLVVCNGAVNLVLVLLKVPAHLGNNLCFAGCLGLLRVSHV